MVAKKKCNYKLINYCSKTPPLFICNYILCVLRWFNGILLLFVDYINTIQNVELYF